MMAYFSVRTLAVIFSFMSVSLLVVYTEEISTPRSSSVKQLTINSVLPLNLSETDIDSADFMLMDVTPGTTPTICRPNGACIFQVFRTVGGTYLYDDPIEYCKCPEHQLCVERGMSIKRCFFYFYCRNKDEVLTTMTESSVRTTSASGMVPQYSATEPGQPVTIRFEGGIPPTMNC